MGRTYSNAEGVLVWLGEEFRGWAQGEFQSFVTRSSPRFVSQVDTLANILKFSWFSRVWVLQENLLARQAIFVWGAEHLPSVRLQEYAWTYSRSFAGRSISWLFKPRLDVSELLHTMRERQCSDDRDRLYGLAGLRHDTSVSAGP